MIKACIFDLDGVIVDTAHYHFLAWKRLAREFFDSDFTLTDNEQLKGVSRSESLDILLKVCGVVGLTDGEKAGIAELKNQWYVEFITTLTPSHILPGVTRFLKSVKRMGFRTAIGSASKNARTILQKLDLVHMFDAVVDGTKIKYAKPHPEVFLKCARELEVEPQECIVFEDAVAGVQAALTAGMLAVGVGNPVQLQKAHTVIDSFEGVNIKAIIKEKQYEQVSKG